MDRQRTFFDDEHEHDQHAKRLARTTDPETSKQAARELVASGQLGDQQRQTLKLIELFPGSTARELKLRGAVIWDPHKRIFELKKLGLIRDGGARKCTITGKSALTWFLRD